VHVNILHHCSIPHWCWVSQFLIYTNKCELSNREAPNQAKLCWSFLPYWSRYVASGTRTNVGRSLILSVGNWLDGCGLLLVDLMWVTGCPALVIREDILIQDYEEHEINTIMMCTDKSFRINTAIFHNKKKIMVTLNPEKI